VPFNELASFFKFQLIDTWKSFPSMFECCINRFYIHCSRTMGNWQNCYRLFTKKVYDVCVS